MKRILFIISILVLLMVGCRSTKPSPHIVVTNTDSVTTVYIETVRIDTIKVEIPVPVESESQIVPDSASHLETSMAVSDAWINSDGTLGHSLSNKQGKLVGETLVPTITKTNEKESVKVREIPVPTPYPVEVERKWTLIEQIKLASFWYLVGTFVILLFYVFRKPILFSLRKVIGF